MIAAAALECASVSVAMRQLVIEVLGLERLFVIL